MTAGFVIIGGGQAAVSAAAKLRELDSETLITVISDEPVLPYQRPPLSKAFLRGDLPLERLILRPQDWFDDQNIDLRLGSRVERIDAENHELTLFDGSKTHYKKLLIATGSTARVLPLAMGGDLDGVHCLRSVAHVDSLRPLLAAGKRLVVIGGGYIGLEVAAVATQMGMSVTVVEMAERILQRVAAPETSDFYRTLHQAHGVTLLEGTGLSKLEDDNGTVTGARLTDGRLLEADCVLVGIGIMPTSGLAELAGLSIENGIAVDAHCATSDLDIFAAGDCASFPYRESRIRLESVPNAINQAEVAAANMVGIKTRYEATPWFWSDQFDVKLQIAGLNTGYDFTLVRPGKREGGQSVWYYRGDQLLAVDAMNDAPAFMMARRIIEAGKTVPKEIAADPAADLKAYM